MGVCRSLIMVACLIAGCESGLQSPQLAKSQPAPIAFAACDASGVSQIVLAEPDGSKPQIITHGENPSWFPAWSPDGARLLFVREAAGVPQLWAMNADGSGAQGLVTSGVSLAGSWSADGRRIAYAHSSDRNKPLKIWTAETDGAQTRRLTTAGESVDENVPRWSPDGAQMTYTSNQRGHYEIWVANVASGVAKPLTQTYFDTLLLANIEQKVPAWSPDGKLIAYWSGVEGSDPRPNLPRDVWVMNADGTDQRQLVNGDDPNWSPTGEFIIHSMPSTDGHPALGTVRPDGTDAKTLFAVNACRPLQSSWYGK